MSTCFKAAGKDSDFLPFLYFYLISLYLKNLTKVFPRCFKSPMNLGLSSVYVCIAFNLLFEVLIVGVLSKSSITGMKLAFPLLLLALGERDCRLTGDCYVFTFVFAVF